MAKVAREAISLLDALQERSGFEAALLTTFNAYFPFLEEVVLRRLRAIGCHYVVTLMDSGQLATELADRTRRPQSAGRRYGLLPILCGSAFHPKITLLVGPKAARVLIGSHNLTISGFIQNREVTNVIGIQGPKDRAGAAILIEALDFCRAWASATAPSLQRALDDFRDLCRPYLGPVPAGGEIDVVGSRPEGASLWQRVRQRLSDRATRIVLVGPFFDEELALVHRVNAELSPRELVIGVDPKTTHFPGNRKKVPREVRVVDARDLDPGHKGRGYLHAKAMLIETTSEQILVTGSANPTAAAWLAPAGSRNAEIVVVRRLSKRGGDDLGLGSLWRAPAVAPHVLAGLRARPEKPETVTGARVPLVGVCRGTSIHIEGPLGDVGGIVVRDCLGVQLASTVQEEAGEIIVSVAERVHDASLIEAMLDGEMRYGIVHHPDLLRDAAVSSSQRRLREALNGLCGDPPQLEALLRLVEKVIFNAQPVEAGVGQKGKTARDSKDTRPGESTVALVHTLKKGPADEINHLSTGDLGLLLDYLMRKLWQSLAHEPSSGIRPETELIDSDDEDLVQELPTDREIAEAWHRKSRTLLRRLRRRVNEGSDAPQVVVETAAVLGVLEAIRRVEDQDRWRTLDAEFVDREEATKFVFNAVPRLLKPRTGLLDVATKMIGGPFPEQQAVIEWLTWLAWLTGFGPSEIWDIVVDEDDEDSGAPIEAPERLARACLIGARATQANTSRIVEILDATPFPGTDARTWLDALTRTGAVYSNPADVLMLNRAPESGDLVVTSQGDGPYVVRRVRGRNVDLIDFGRENETIIVRASHLRVLSTGLDSANQRAARG